MKLGIIVDSSTALTAEEAKSYGWGFIPTTIIINDKPYTSGLTLSQEDFFKNVTMRDDVRTATAPVGHTKEVLARMAKSHDAVLCCIIPRTMSSQISVVSKIAGNYKNVFVPETIIMGLLNVKIIRRCQEMAKKGKNIEKIVAEFERLHKSTCGMLMPENMRWLKQGGRISPMVALLANLTRIVPVIYYDGTFHRYEKARSWLRAASKAIVGISKKTNRPLEFFEWDMMSANNPKTAGLVEALEKKFNIKIRVTPFPLELVSHVGINAIALSVIPKELKKS